MFFSNFSSFFVMHTANPPARRNAKTSTKMGYGASTHPEARDVGFFTEGCEVGKPAWWYTSHKNSTSSSTPSAQKPRGTSHSHKKKKKSTLGPTTHPQRAMVAMALPRRVSRADGFSARDTQTRVHDRQFHGALSLSLSLNPPPPRITTPGPIAGCRVVGGVIVESFGLGLLRDSNT